MVSALNAKLRRDLWRMKGQAIAIGLVISMGVMMQVMMSGLVLSLSETRQAYYDRYRLAEVFAPVIRAPEHVASRLAAIPGVSQVETRVVSSAQIDVAGRDLPVAARAISLPDRAAPRLNDIHMTAGRMFDSDRAEEVVLLDSFAKAQGLSVGASLRTTINGTRRDFLIVGTAQSPEFLYTSAPGEMVPDDARFGVIWMSRAALSAMVEMNGAFNEALFALTRGASVPEVIDRIDTILSPYGGPAAYGLEDLFSNNFVSQELDGLRASSTGVPPVFLAVAAFLLYIVISRLVQSEREEIGLMKAFGYTSFEVGGHYMRLVLTIAIGGALAGCLFGIGAGRALVGVYLQFFKFPFLVFGLDPASFVTGVAASVAAASAGGILVLRRVFSLAPAEAMRPPAPADYSRAGRMFAGVAQWLDQPSRMVLRRITRQPGRMIGAVIGIAAGMGLSLAMITLTAGFDRTLDLSFTVLDRSDATVAFTHPIGPSAIFALRRIEGVTVAEPIRQVAVVWRNGRQTHKGAITGLAPDPQLGRAIGPDYLPIALPERGLVITPALADILGVGLGDTVTVEVREGTQPVLTLPIAAIAQSLLGAPSYMDLEALNRALGDGMRVSGAYLRIDAARAAEVHRQIKEMPAVAGVSLKSDAAKAFETIMNSGAGSVRYVMGLIAFVITFGIVYNAARVAQAERARDLASLRVIGFHTGETAFVLLGELAAVVVIALPIGSLMGQGLSSAVAEGFSTELYQIPSLFLPASHGYAAVIVLTAALLSGWIVKRDIDRADLISALKTRD